MISPLDEFIAEARQVSVEEAAERLGLEFTGKRYDHAQPCPACGGTDAFSFNTAKNAWNCRKGGVGGRDAIGLAAHVLELDLRRRETFLEACAAVTGREIPEGGERETEEERAARKARLLERKMRHEQEAAARAAEHGDFREKERNKARGIYRAAVALASASVPHGRFYLQYRGCGVPEDRWLRVSAEVPYWHGQDERGHPAAIHTGATMIAPFVDVATGKIIGCHITWIDLEAPPKFRPVLADPETGELLPTKKMRGTKKGGVIPLAGDPSARRWLGAEGIENTLAFGRWERFRADTFYFAAGDLGSLAGPADPSSRFAHPSLTKPDRNGRARPVMIAGPVPLLREAPGGEPDAMVVPEHVDELVLLGDGDSEPVFTAAAMARARARHARPGRRIPVVWPRTGTDFAKMLAGAD
jgi:hypothetical protein